ncbi:hypothetical protein [Nocardioides sp. zg-1228]|uniref:hypothetical protein n=1 Tax=Nocardioides sp. zg-1228 TaxID=2763008 RepID=UPI001642985D|nr:hypothetical protein [Nocardioides sp. zg-1228]MBC2934480.1 hypothetical protein [Nocardioides sp. zg-1228]QSF59241.1 hypothetical protein JX575_08835 [Nocardioides sp. zg-1228]
MPDASISEVIVLVILWTFPAAVLYWIIRLGVRHGTLDAYRIDRTDQRIAAMQADLRPGRPSSAGD